MITDREVFEAMLARFVEVRVAFVYHEKLKVPESIVPAEGEAQILSYGLDMPVPIPDLRIDELGIEATLVFSGVFEKTFVPWDAVIDMLGFYPKKEEPVRPKLILVP